MTSDHRIMCPCFMCRRDFQMGPHRYDGHYIGRYKLSVCDTCWNANWDGWAPDFETRLVAHLSEQHLPIPDRNEKGWLPRE